MEVMTVRNLTNEEIAQFASGAGVKKIAVENFLSTMGENRYVAQQNMALDARLYKWNAATKNAIMKGIKYASK